MKKFLTMSLFLPAIALIALAGFGFYCVYQIAHLSGPGTFSGSSMLPILLYGAFEGQANLDLAAVARVLENRSLLAAVLGSVLFGLAWISIQRVSTQSDRDED